jgi:hypothetical protein
LLTRLLAARGERSEKDCETSQRERELHCFQRDFQRPDRFQHFRIFPNRSTQLWDIGFATEPQSIGREVDLSIFSFPFFLRVSVALCLIHLISAVAGAREFLIHLVNANIFVVTQSSRRGRVNRGSRLAVFSVWQPEQGDLTGALELGSFSSR